MRLRLSPIINSVWRPSYSISRQQKHGYMKMASRTYDDAVGLLNTLQTPYHILQERIAKGIRLDKTANDEMRKCLSRIGYSQADLTKLNIVHVAGTKGKGSTCTFVDSILSQYRKSRGIPKKVGLFTSPHLIHVRERIRIDSEPISSELFAKYFFEVWDKLEHAATVENTPFEKPVYFRYLTLLSWHVFIQEGVDAAVYEVGVGGEYDSTNVVDCPAVTGISALGIDHTFSLGTTLDSISWHKAGILKPSTPAFTVPQPRLAIPVLESRARERGVSSFTILPPDTRLANVRIRPAEMFQHLNASLAIALTETVLAKIDPTFTISETDEEGKSVLPEEFVKGLEDVVWSGRCEVKTWGGVRWYLDGAHTEASLRVAAKWFCGERSKTAKKSFLIFNQQGHRDAVPLLEAFFKAMHTNDQPFKFNTVIFCPTVPPTSASTGDKGKTQAKEFANAGTDEKAVRELTLQKEFREKWIEMSKEREGGDRDRDGKGGTETEVLVLGCVEKAIEFVRGEAEKGEGEIEVLVTGSVHLIGRVLGIMEEEDGGGMWE